MMKPPDEMLGLYDNFVHRAVEEGKMLSLEGLKKKQ